jgi:uncharacterized membrane protein (UPF0127 family)
MRLKLHNNLNRILQVGVVIFIGVAVLVNNRPSPGGEPEKVLLDIAGKTYTLLTARTSAVRTKGLSGIRELNTADGMIFYFDPPQKISFWNKNTYLDLELIWFRNGRIIGRDFLPSEGKDGLISIESPSEVDAVVELVQ